MSGSEISPEDWAKILRFEEFGNRGIVSGSKHGCAGTHYHHASKRKGMYTVYLCGPVVATYDFEVERWFSPDWPARAHDIRTNGRYPSDLHDRLIHYSQKLGSTFLRGPASYETFISRGFAALAAERLNIGENQ